MARDTDVQFVPTKPGTFLTITVTDTDNGGRPEVEILYNFDHLEKFPERFDPAFDAVVAVIREFRAKLDADPDEGNNAAAPEFTA